MNTIILPKVIGTNNGTVLLNNAATTPPFASTLKTVNEFLQTYGALHRGAGPYANITCEKVTAAIATISQFVNASKDQSLVFTQNTSAAINLFVRLLRLSPEDMVITSTIEHTSNNLPWQFNTPARKVYVNAFDDGSLDYEDLERLLKENSPRVKVVAITGASNLTGYAPDMAKLTELSHRYGAMLFVDAAQLAPHRPIDMKGQNIDALAFSAHKVYAPFGLGILALPSKLLEDMPVDPGGGSIDMISEKDILWAPANMRHQTGTWNVTGIIATAASCEAIMKIGWHDILAHERELVNYTAKQLATVPGLKLYVPLEKYGQENRIGTFTFNLPGYHHALLSAILANEYNIETRAGVICNHRLVRRWFNVSDVEQQQIEEQIKAGNRLASYGIVRVSLGIHNTKSDIDALVTALDYITRHGPKLKYKPVPEEEMYIVEK